MQETSPEDVGLSKAYNLSYCLATINSRLNQWYFLIFVGGQLHTYPDDIKSFRIRRVSFTTPQGKRKRLCKTVKELYENCLKTSDHGSIVAFVAQRLSARPEESDVIHDLLAHLAEKMIRYNKEKNEEVKSFLGWLERELGAKIDALSGKTIIKDYHQYEMDKLIDVLKKNKKHLQIEPFRREFQDKLIAEFNQSLKKLNPLKQKIQLTDTLIDQIVYKLYGLTEEEIRIVKGEIEKDEKR